MYSSTQEKEKIVRRSCVQFLDFIELEANIMVEVSTAIIVSQLPNHPYFDPNYKCGKYE